LASVGSTPRRADARARRYSSGRALAACLLAAAPIAASPRDQRAELPTTIETGAGRIELGGALRREVHATVELDNRAETRSGKLQVFLALPGDNERQRVSDLVVYPEPASVIADEHGNRIAEIAVPDLAPGDRAVVGWRASVEVHAVRHHVDATKLLPLSQVPEEIRRLYLRDASMYDLRSSVVTSALQEAVGRETDLLRRVEAIHDYVTRRLTYRRDDGWKPAPAVLEAGSGSCSEYHFAFASLCRAAGIPVRWAGGSVFQGRDVYRDSVWHRWSEVYLPGHGWFPIDVTWDDADRDAPARTYFGATASRFVVLTRGDLGDEHPLRWHYVARVKGRSLRGGVEVSVTWTPVLSAEERALAGRIASAGAAEAVDASALRPDRRRAVAEWVRFDGLRRGDLGPVARAAAMSAGDDAR
jgi:transglutaminase-like putative cysteine protease